jgi:hypothetical protein
MAEDGPPFRAVDLVRGLWGDESIVQLLPGSTCLTSPFLDKTGATSMPGKDFARSHRTSDSSTSTEKLSAMLMSQNVGPLAYAWSEQWRFLPSISALDMS